MDLKLLPLPQNQPASVCCDLVHQIDGRHQQERVRDWVQCCTGHMYRLMYRHKCTHMYRHSRVKLERKRVVGMVQWSQRCWDQLSCIYENAQWSYTKKKNRPWRKAIQRKCTAEKSSSKKICSEEKQHKCNQCGGKGAMVTAVLRSVKMLSPPPLITPTLHRNIRPGHKILTSTSAKGPLDFKRFQIIASSHKNVLNVKSLNI